MSNSIPSDLILRVRRQLRRQDLKGTIGKAAQYARSSVYTDETHVWYGLPLGADRPRIDLPQGLTLIQGGTDKLPLLDELPTVIEAEAKRRMLGGADLWMVLEEQRPAFACWIFRGSMPMLAARNGHLMLPPEIVCLEDSVTSASYRGRGIAPAAWSQIADRIEQTPVKSIITKIEESNTPSRRAVTKCGFREIATMHFRRVATQRHTTVQAGTGATADWLVQQLSR